MNTKRSWKPKANEILEVQLEPTNKMDKFSSGGGTEKENYRTSIHTEKLDVFPKLYFTSIGCENNECKVEILDGKAVNLGDGMGIKSSVHIVFP